MSDQRKYVRCFSIGNNVEFSYETAEDVSRLWPEAWKEIEYWDDLPGINIHRLPEGSILIGGFKE